MTGRSWTRFLHSLDNNALILFDGSSAAALVSSMLNSVRSGTLKPMAILPIVDAETFKSKITLTRMNVTIWSC